MAELVVQRNSVTERIVWVLGVCCGLLALAYGLYINATILHVVAREKAQSAVSTMRGQVALLENTYFTLEKAITIEAAQARGFHDAVDMAYLERGVTTGLSFNQNGR